MKKKQDKTNVMRILDKHKINYDVHHYDNTKTNAIEVANEVGIDSSSVFKTLVTISKSKTYYVFMIPSNEELDLKKGAKAVKEKSIEMIPQKELLPLTGYIHGGCSPIGMKKQFNTSIDQSVTSKDKICFSGGQVGTQIEMNFDDLKKVINISISDLIKERTA